MTIRLFLDTGCLTKLKSTTVLWIKSPLLEPPDGYLFLGSSYQAVNQTWRHISNKLAKLILADFNFFVSNQHSQDITSTDTPPTIFHAIFAKPQNKISLDMNANSKGP